MSRLETVKDDLPALGIADAWAIVREPVESVTALGTGNRSRVYRVTQADGAVRLLRITAKGSGRVEREARVRALLAGDRRVPTVQELLVRDHAFASQCEVVTMREVPGETLHVALGARSEADALALWRAYGEGLAAIHQRALPGFGLLGGDGRGQFRRWRDAMEAAAALVLRYVRSTSLADLGDAVMARLDALAPAHDAVIAGALLHGDPQPQNVLTAGGRITAFIDFEYASVGDPLYELTFVSSLLEPDATNPFRDRPLAAWREAFADGYTAVGSPPSDEGAPRRSAFYRLLHAARASEFLRVGSAKLPSVVGARFEAALRAQIVRALDGES